MPVVPTIPPLTSPPTNVFGLYQYVAQRIPGYDPSEYYRELNSAYIHVWEEVSKLKNHYFTNISTLTVVNASRTFDLLQNSDGNLSGPLSQRLYQITRIRVLPPAGGLYQATTNFPPNEQDFIALSANPTASAAQTGPYYWFISGRGQLNWALPIAAGSTLEIMYTFWPIQLVASYAGTVSSVGTAVTGSGTAFTSLLQPDFQAALPTAAFGQEQIQVELVCNNNQIYRVVSIASGTALTTQNAVAPALGAGSQYALATLPEIPREHIRVIASIATSKMYSLAADDARAEEWTAIAASNMQMMKDSLIERQSNNPPRRQRFPYGIGRRNRAFLS